MDFGLLVEQVRAIFYPQWDKKREWRIVEADDDDLELYGGCHGKCNGEKKTITISQPILAKQTVDENWLLLIHEIAHAQAPGHGKKWQDRMERAALKARSIGRHQLSTLIFAELKEYREAPRESFCATVYYSIRDAVTEYERHLEFKEVVAWVSRRVSTPPSELLERCKRAKTVYDKAIKERRREDQLRQSYLGQREQKVAP